MCVCVWLVYGKFLAIIWQTNRIWSLNLFVLLKWSVWVRTGIYKMNQFNQLSSFYGSFHCHIFLSRNNNNSIVSLSLPSHICTVKREPIYQTCPVIWICNRKFVKFQNNTCHLLVLYYYYRTLFQTIFLVVEPTSGSDDTLFRLWNDFYPWWKQWNYLYMMAIETNSTSLSCHK